MLFRSDRANRNEKWGSDSSHKPNSLGWTKVARSQRKWPWRISASFCFVSTNSYTSTRPSTGDLITMKTNRSPSEFPVLPSRRAWLQRAGCGFGWLGLQSLISQADLGGKVYADGLGERSTSPLAPRQSHFPARAKRVVWIFEIGRAHV